MATPASVLTVEDIPKKPHQPPASYKFPKRTFGKKKQCLVISSIPGSTNGHEANDVAFGRHKMSSCLQAEEENTDPALVSCISFTNTILTVTGVITLTNTKKYTPTRPDHFKSAFYGPVTVLFRK